MRILITGATGSLGTALIEHWLKSTDYRLICYSRDELKQAQLKERFPDPRLDCFLGDVRDLPRLHLAFEANVDVVIHAAALKRVDAISYNPEESLKTNVQGSMNVLHAARGKVGRCLLISTDKACYPTNAYGLSKAFSEHLFTAFNASSIPKGTMSATVRYGNVLGSRGSVVSVWRSQVSRGLPLTLTDERMTRFLITFPRAIQMIETALDQMEGGEVFVPRLEAARMMDLAMALKEGVYGEFARTGLRPGGEKLDETLMTWEEQARASNREGYAIIPPDHHPWRNAPYEGGQDVYPSEWFSGSAPRMGLDALRELLEGV